MLLVVRRNYKTIVEDHEDVGGVVDGHGVENQRTKTGGGGEITLLVVM